MLVPRSSWIVVSSYERRDGKWSLKVRPTQGPDVDILHHENIEQGKRVQLVGKAPNYTVKP